MSLQSFFTWYLFLSLSLISVYDIYALLYLDANKTVSYECYELGKRFPSLYLFLGVMIGHIIFPLHIVVEKLNGRK
jgi:hypothetical protein